MAKQLWVPLFADSKINYGAAPCNYDHAVKWGKVSKKEAEDTYAEGLSEGWVTEIVCVDLSESDDLSF